MCSFMGSHKNVLITFFGRGGYSKMFVVSYEKWQADGEEEWYTCTVTLGADWFEQLRGRSDDMK